MIKEHLMADEDSAVNFSFPKSDNDDDEEDILYAENTNSDDFQLKPKAEVGIVRNFTDCSNVFKAFIGSALIGLPFAVLQAGVVLAVVCVLLIALATDHCCALIVKCKRLVITKILEEKLKNGATKQELNEQELILGRSLSFGRIGKACMGRPGLLAVNISVMVTQFGFSIGYFIFLGNTLRTLIQDLTHIKRISPTTNTTTQAALTTQLFMTVAPTTKLFTQILNDTLFSTAMPSSNSTNSFQLAVSHIYHQVVHEPWSPKNLSTNSYPTFGFLLLLPFLILVPISFIRNLRKLAPISVIANASITGAFAATAIYIISSMNGIAPKPVVLFKKKTFPIFFGQVTGAFEGIGTVIPIEGSMDENRHRYPCFLHVSMCLMSVILGSFGIIGYLAYGDDTCQIVTSNLTGDFSIALKILLFVGVLFTYPLQIYPCIQITERVCIKFKQWRLQRKCKQRSLSIIPDSKTNTSADEAAETLLGNSDLSHDNDDVISIEELKTMTLKRWEGNLIRVGLVTFTACVALAFRSQFAYISALTGSVGSSLLSYILPPIFHISLERHHMKPWVLVKNIILVLFGIVGGLMGFIVTIQEIVSSFDSGQRAHC